MEEVYIVSGVRTAIGKYGGSLKNVPAHTLMEKLDMNEKGFALLMNVTPSTVRLWTSGAVQPSGTAKRLMQIYETGPEIVSKIAGGQHPEDGNAYK